MNDHLRQLLQRRFQARFVVQDPDADPRPSTSAGRPRQDHPRPLRPRDPSADLFESSSDDSGQDEHRWHSAEPWSEPEMRHLVAERARHRALLGDEGVFQSIAENFFWRGRRTWTELRERFTLLMQIQKWRRIYSHEVRGMTRNARGATRRRTYPQD